MIVCAISLSLLLCVDATLALRAVGSPGLVGSILFWMIAYPALVYGWPSLRNGLRWSVLIVGVALGFTLDFVILKQSFQWFAAVLLVVAAGHFAGWAEAVHLLVSQGQRRSQPEARHGRPAAFSVALAASFILAYFCQSPVSKLTTREGLIASFGAVALGFLAWELGRSRRSRHATVASRPGIAGRVTRWLGAAMLGGLAFFAFAQVLPLTAEKLSDPTPSEFSAENLAVPDLPDLDESSHGESSSPSGSLPDNPTSENLPSGLSQEAGGREAESLPGEESESGVGGTAGSQGPVAASDRRDLRPAEDELEDPEEPPPPELAVTSPINPGDAFWDLPSAMVWPFLILVGIAAIVGLLVLWFSQSSSRSTVMDDDAPRSRRPFWEEESVPGYLREFFARSAGIGYEKERGHTLREFLRLLRRAKVTRDEFDDLRSYHYDVQFENKPRDPAAERSFRRKAKEFLR